LDASTDDIVVVSVTPMECLEVLGKLQKLAVEIVVETFDAPYCDSFVCKECWVVIGSEANEL
jgi:hypothetical protein